MLPSNLIIGEYTELNAGVPIIVTYVFVEKISPPFSTNFDTKLNDHKA